MWKVCTKCRALCPEETTFCPNCAPRGTAWLRWFRGAVGAASLGVLGTASACCLGPVVEGEDDAGLVDAGLDSGVDAGIPDAGTPDSGLTGGLDAGIDAGTFTTCYCSGVSTADYGIASGTGGGGGSSGCVPTPAPSDGGCPVDSREMCQVCPEK